MVTLEHFVSRFDSKVRTTFYKTLNSVVNYCLVAFIWMITGRHRFLPTDPPYAARKQHHRKILLSSRFIIVVTLFIYRLKSCTSSTAWLTAPQKESFACSKLRVRKHEHENKTGGNWGEEGPPPFFLQITHSYLCLPFTHALSVLSESLEQATENAPYRTSFSVFFVFPPQPYVNIHGQLVRPPSRESDEFLRPESLRSSRDTLTPEPEMPVRPRQPRGSEFDDRREPEINYFSYLVWGDRKLSRERTKIYRRMSTTWNILSGSPL